MQWLLNQPAEVLWLLVGLGCLGVSLVAFEPTIAAIGIAALITAIAAMTVQPVPLQVMIWAVLSIALALVLRGLVPKESQELRSPEEAEVSVAIPPGGEGEVTYEGSYWTARCQISDVAIAAGQTVHVVGRQGNTLIVLPVGGGQTAADEIQPRP